MVDIILALLYFALIGWVAHSILGRKDNVLHYCLVGGAGSGLGALLEFITGRYTTTFFGAIGLCILCSCGIEYGIGALKRRILTNRMQ